MSRHRPPGVHQYDTRCCLNRCMGQSLARIMHDTTVARLFAHFSFELAPRMGGPAGVDAKVGLCCCVAAPSRQQVAARAPGLQRSACLSSH